MYLCQHPVIPLNQTKAQSLLPRFAPPTKHALFFSSLSQHVDNGSMALGRKILVCANSDFNHPRDHLQAASSVESLALLCYIVLALKSHDIEVHTFYAGNCGQRQQNLDKPVWPARLSLRLPTVFRIREWPYWGYIIYRVHWMELTVSVAYKLWILGRQMDTES